MVLTLEHWFLAFVRLLSLLMTGPLVGHRSLPLPMRIALAASLAWLVVTTSGPLAPLGAEVWAFLLLVGRELFVGAGVGLAASLALTGLQMAGGIVGAALGLSSSQILDPLNGYPSALMDQLYTLTASLLFLALQGHHFLFRAAWQTFQVLPLGSEPDAALAALRLSELVGVLLSAALQIALPALCTVLLTDLVLGLTNRALPQMNVFFVGLPFKIGLGLIALAVSLPLVEGVMRSALYAGMAAGAELWRAAP